MRRELFLLSRAYCIDSEEKHDELLLLLMVNSA